MSAINPIDLSDTEWEYLTWLLPAKRPRGRQCGHPLRAILDAIFTGCAWRGCPLGSILVDTVGLPISMLVTPADTHDKVGAWRLVAGLKPLVPRPRKIWADGAYTSGKLARWCKADGAWDLEIVGRDPEAGLRGPAAAVGGGTVIRAAGAQSSPAHQLRTDGADERDADRGRDDPPAPAAARESGMTTPKHALSAKG